MFRIWASYYSSEQPNPSQSMNNLQDQVGITTSKFLQKVENKVSTVNQNNDLLLKHIWSKINILINEKWDAEENSSQEEAGVKRNPQSYLHQAKAVNSLQKNNSHLSKCPNQRMTINTKIPQFSHSFSDPLPSFNA